MPSSASPLFVERRLSHTVLPVARGLGLLMHVPAAMAALALVVCALFGEWGGVGAFAVTGGCAVFLGQALYHAARRGPQIQRYHAMLVASLGWLLVSAVAALPYMLLAHSDYGVGVLASPVNAFFETISGFTTTGLSLLSRPSQLSHALQWWRSLSAWVGGVGVIVLMISIMSPTRAALNLYLSEGRDEKILPTVKSTAFAIWSIYLFYTVFSFALLWLVGEPVWRALNHAMTGVATGGFTITDQSLKGLSPLTQLAYVPVMLIGAIGFSTHYRAVRQGRVLSALFGGAEQRLFWGLLVVGGGLVWLERVVAGQQPGWVPTFVEWVSAFTTSGFSSSHVGQWPTAALFLMTLTMLAGAMVGSTGGGVKLLRVVLIYKGFIWHVRRLGRKPHEVIRHRMDGEVLTPAQADARVRAAGILIAAWLLVFALGILLLLYFLPAHTPFEVVVFEAAAAQGNAGLWAGLKGSNLDLGAKIVLIALMWVGRLEMVPLMVLSTPLLTRRL